MAGTPSNISRLAAAKRRPRQQTLEAVLNRAWSSKLGAPGSSPATAQSVDDDTDDDACNNKHSNKNSDESDDDDEDEDDLPIRRRPRRSGKTLFHAGRASGDIRSALLPVAVPAAATVANSSSQRRSRTAVIDSEDEGGSDDDDDDDVRPAKRRRPNRRALLPFDDGKNSSSLDEREDDDDSVVLTPQPKSNPRTTAPAATRTPKARLVRRSQEHPAAASAADVLPRSARKRMPQSARSARQRHLELLRRRRMGEKVTTSDLEGSSGEEEYDDAAGSTPRIALYDKDPDHVALSDFEDEEEEDKEEEDSSEDENEEEEEADEEEKEDVECSEDGDNDAEEATLAPQDPEKAKKRKRKEEKRRLREQKKREKEEKKEKKKKQEEDAIQFAKIMHLSSRFDDELAGGSEDDGYGFDEEGGGRPDDEEAVEDDMADFIDDSHVVGLIGAPDDGVDLGTEEARQRQRQRQRAVEDEMALLRREMPLQFTFQAHKPLKSHFKDAVEWLVHRRINRSTDGDGDGHSSKKHAAPVSFAAYCNDEVYKVAWDRLDREIGGLAQSRFISSSWTPEFNGALQARPYMDSFNLRPGRGAGGGSGNIFFPGAEENICHACGRTNHPASYRVEFSGKAYDSNTLDDMEEGGEDDDSDNAENESIDMHGNTLPSTARQWYVGAVCHSNAETAHGLLHWRRALLDWVEEKLAADRLLERLEGSGGSKKHKKPMKARKRRDYANEIVDGWESNGTINSLFRDFMKLLEGAQAKSNMTLSRYRR